MSVTPLAAVPNTAPSYRPLDKIVDDLKKLDQEELALKGRRVTLVAELKKLHDDAGALLDGIKL